MRISDWSSDVCSSDLMTDMNIDKMFVPRPRRTPHCFDQLPTAERHPRPSGQCRQHVEFRPSQQNRFLGDRDLSPGNVDPEHPERHWRTLLVSGYRSRSCTVRDSAAGSAHHRADPRYQLSGAERLAHVIIGTDRKPDDGVHFLTTSSQHHHVCIRKCRSEEHTSELHSLMRISYAVFFLTQKNNRDTTDTSLTSHT